MASSFNTIAGRSYRPSTNGLANTELFHIEPEHIATLHDMSNEELSSFVELHEGLVNDVQIELCVLTHFLLWTKTPLAKHLEQAIQRMEGWVAVTDVDNSDRARRLQILDMMSARLYALQDISQELLPSLTEGR